MSNLPERSSAIHEATVRAGDATVNYPARYGAPARPSYTRPRGKYHEGDSKDDGRRHRDAAVRRPAATVARGPAPEPAHAGHRGRDLVAPPELPGDRAGPAEPRDGPAAGGRPRRAAPRA